MFFGFDETWRWRYREDELRFNQFWIQTVRYLARSRLGQVALTLDRQTPYRRGEPIKVTVRFPDDAPPLVPDIPVTVVLERLLPGRGGRNETEIQTLTLSKVEGSRATYEGLVTVTPEGDYRFWLSSPSVSGAKPRTECRVLAPPGEMDRLRMNQQDMERAAEETPHLTQSRASLFLGPRLCHRRCCVHRDAACGCSIRLRFRNAHGARGR